MRFLRASGSLPLEPGELKDRPVLGVGERHPQCADDALQAVVRIRLERHRSEGASIRLSGLVAIDFMHGQGAVRVTQNPVVPAHSMPGCIAMTDPATGCTSTVTLTCWSSLPRMVMSLSTVKRPSLALRMREKSA